MHMPHSTFMPKKSRNICTPSKKKKNGPQPQRHFASQHSSGIFKAAFIVIRKRAEGCVALQGLPVRRFIHLLQVIQNCFWNNAETYLQMDDKSNSRGGAQTDELQPTDETYRWVYLNFLFV